MKKTVALILVVVMLLSLSSCSAAKLFLGSGVLFEFKDYAEDYVESFIFDKLNDRESIFNDNDFAAAIADAITVANKEESSYYKTLKAEDITQEMLDEITGFIVTVNAVDQDGTYAPVVLLTKEDYTEYYIDRNYDREDEGEDSTEKEIPTDYYYVIYDLKDLSDLKLFRNLKLIEISGLNTRSLYNQVQQYYYYYAMYGGTTTSTNPYMVPAATFTDPTIIDREDLTDLSVFSDLSKLEYLCLGYSGLTTLDGLEKATNLKFLELSNCDITDISALGKLTSLTGINLSGNKLESLECISSNKDLELLYIGNCGIKNLDSLKGFTELEKLDVSDNAITSLQGIGSFKKLTYLYAQNNEIADLGDLGSATALTSINLANNNITDLTALGTELTEVTSINLADNKELATLNGMEKAFDKTKLTSIDLSIEGNENNRIVDWKPLYVYTEATITGMPEAVEAEFELIKNA